jgi:hypothetical protein
VDLSATSPASTGAIAKKTEDIPPEILPVIAAAAAAFLGAGFQIRSIELLNSPRESVSRWTRQGRAFIQASHNIRPKR